MATRQSDVSHSGQNRRNGLSRFATARHDKVVVFRFEHVAVPKFVGGRRAYLKIGAGNSKLGVAPVV